MLCKTGGLVRPFLPDTFFTVLDAGKATMGYRATTRIRICAVLAVFVPPACGPGGNEPVTLTGDALPGCGPADGPAVELYLSSDSLPSPEWAADTVSVLSLAPILEGSEGPLLVRLLIWQSAEQLERRTVRFDEDGRAGAVSLCRLGVGCEIVNEGWLRVDSVDGTTIRGTLEVRSVSGLRVDGRFEAERVDRQVLCG